MFGKDKEGIKKAMLEDMDISVIPDYLGGNCKTPFNE